MVEIQVKTLQDDGVCCCETYRYTRKAMELHVVFELLLSVVRDTLLLTLKVEIFVIIIDQLTVFFVRIKRVRI